MSSCVDNFEILENDSQHNQGSTNEVTATVPNSDVVTKINDLVKNHDSEVTGLRKSHNDDSAKNAKNAQYESTKTIDIELSPSRDASRDNQAEIDRCVKRLVYEMVEKVSRKYEKYGENIGGDDVFIEDTLEDEKPNPADSDDTKFHEKLLAVKMTSDRMKEKSQISISVLKELKNVCVEITNDNIRLQQIINSLQDQCYDTSLSVSVTM